MLYKKESNRSVESTRQRVEAATVANKFGVMATFNLKEKMLEKGVEFVPECFIIEICNPHQAKRVLEANMDISTALPCRISVYEDDGKVFASTIRPTAILGMFGVPELTPVAAAVELTMVQIIDEACAK